MLEALAHNQLKALLEGCSLPWPHNLTLSRLVARSLRRRDFTILELDIDSQNFWWIGFLLPLCLESSRAVLLLSEKQQSRLVNIEIPILQKAGFDLPIWEGLSPPKENEVWLINYFDIVSIFPGMFESPFGDSIIRRAREKGLLEIRIHDLRDFTLNKHRKVDDTPFGGGVGMIMNVEPIARALETIKKEVPKAKTILLSPGGKPFDQKNTKIFSRSCH